MSKWISVKERLPEDEQSILTCYYDECLEDFQVGLLAYYKAGTVIDNRVDRHPGHSKSERVFNTLFNKEYEIIAPEDGFYIGEWDIDGDSVYRKHKDCITHWMPLPEGPSKEL
ncbi:DUF551 domain-containing protein [Parasporobacterium paucivorans]|uniref:DUF551 domain-containing protein n=1 Tax=Parasporobacterium paucivorans DSM 15970 TaxID=1122934 RepID=A0A1M6B6T3_9FIRM|nr:DUF551 domain-containing protein [Parasporobacterium paucivorans]SHI44426.1 Protein of unknown function [Parasporobacterium paucivorans DSM 15970]